MKKILFSFCFLFLIIYSCIYPEITLEASKNGLYLWFNQILPALLPFTILSSILIQSKFLDSFSGNANIIAILITMICGFIFGFPIGAKLASDFYKNGHLSEKQAHLLAITTNNFSPMYVCGFVLPKLFTTEELNQNHLVLTSYLLVYFVPLTISFILLLFGAKSTPNLHISGQKNSSASEFEISIQLIDSGIINGFTSLIKICGYIVFFSILSNILLSFVSINNIGIAWLIENIEISNGISLLSECQMQTNHKYIIAVQLLSFGGLSGLAQSASLLTPNGLSVYKYTIGKVLLSLLISVIAAIYVL